MLQGQTIPLPFPIMGINENTAYAGAQGEVTVAPDLMQNVRAHDALERRRRGGQRTGISKQAADQVNSSNAIQNLTPIVEALDLVQSAAWGDQYTNPTAGLANFYPVEWSPGGSHIARKSASREVTVFLVSGTTVSAQSAAHTLTGLGSNANANVQSIAWNSDGSVLFVACASSTSDETLEAYPYSASTGFGAQLDSVNTVATSAGEMSIAVAPDNSAVVVVSEATPYLEGWPWTGTAFGTKYSDPATLPGGGALTSGNHHVEFHPDGDVVIADGGSGNLGAWAFNSSTGFGTKYTDPVSIGGGTLSGGFTINPAGTLVVRVPNSSGSSIEVWPFDKTTGWGGKTSETGTTGNQSPRFHPDGTYIALADTTSGEPRIYPFTNTLGTNLTTPGSLGAGCYRVDWSPDGTAIAWSIGGGGTTNRGLATYQFIAAGINPTAREQRIVAVAGGSVYRSNTDLDEFTLVSSGGSALDSTNPQIMAATSFQRLFFCDRVTANYQFLDFADNTFKDWATSVTAGSLPQGTTDTTKACGIIALYRGRIVMSGLQEEPQNWFMSRSGDPFDWDYSPATTDALQPVAGNNSDAGELGDIITALAPYQDDILIMGGANSIWVMRGDPAAGGRIDNVSRGIGIVGPEAWCFDNVGNFYFFGINGLYRMAGGVGQPELVSQGKLDRTLSDIDTTTKIIRLAYDSKWQGVGIFISDSSQPTTAPTHYFYDARVNGFFPDVYTAAIGPSAIAELFDINPENNTVLLGGFDGYVRKFDDTVNDDDGSAIDSFVRLPIVHPQLTMGQFMLTDLQLHLDAAGGASTALDIYVGDTPEEVTDATASSFNATLAAGRNLPFRKRLRGNSIQMRLRNNTAGETWAYEAGSGVIAGVGRQRKRL